LIFTFGFSIGGIAIQRPNEANARKQSKIKNQKSKIHNAVFTKWF